MEVTEEGIVILVRPVQPSKADQPMFVTPLFISTVLTEAEFCKIYFGTSVPPNTTFVI